MRKIPTLFKRDWDSRDHNVIPELEIDYDFEHAVATEKLDGTNVRLTIRNHKAVRVEKRRNPSAVEKKLGIVDPWYVDSTPGDPADKYIWEAVNNTDLSEVPDGEWSGEALGPSIQGNELNLEKNTVFLFSFEPILKRVMFKKEEVPHMRPGMLEICGPYCCTTVQELYDKYKEWLPAQKSLFGKDCGIEGIVWHSYNESSYEDNLDGPMCKLKVKDFNGEHKSHEVS